MAFEIPQVPFKLTPEDMGKANIARSIGEGQSIISKLIADHLNNLAAQKVQQELPYAADMAQADLLAKQNQGNLLGEQAKYYGRDTESNIAYRKSMADQNNYKLQHPGYLGTEETKLLQYLKDTGLLNHLNNNQNTSQAQPNNSLGGPITPIPGNKMAEQIADVLNNNQQSNVLNPNAQAKEPSPLDKYVAALLNKPTTDIDYKKAMTKYYNSGGFGAKSGVYNALDQNYLNNVALDNPQLNGDPVKIREAANAVSDGIYHLADGTQLNKPSRQTIDAYNAKFLKTSTSPLITAGVKANAAESEMPILDKYISHGRDPYGTTGPGGISLNQISDAINIKDKKAQERLGDYIASEMLAFDKAALQTRIAGTESGVTIIDEAMKKAKQTINAKYPMLSNAARQRALETMSRALTEALHARNKFGVGASGAAGKKFGSNNSNSNNADNNDRLGIL